MRIVCTSWTSLSALIEWTLQMAQKAQVARTAQMHGFHVDAGVLIFLSVLKEQVT